MKNNQTMAEIVTLDVGGRSYKTTIGTLANSGSAYFHSLIARWMPTDDDDDTNTGVDDIGTSSSSNKRQKRERNKQKTGTTDAIVKNIFVDRDPDVFEDILYFMRCNCLKPATYFDPFLLRMILNEAQFFAYDVLVKTVNKRLQEIEQDVKTDISKLPACSGTLQVTASETTCTVKLKKDEVLYITSAVLAGRCRIDRYVDEDKKDKDSNINGCYLETYRTGDVGDFQLNYGFTDDVDVGPEELHCISHVGLDQIHCGNIPTNIDFRQTIDMCISKSDDDDYIRLSATGSGTWHVHYWAGLPEDIPVLNTGGGAQSNNDATKKRRYIQAMINQKKKKSSSDELALMYMFAATTATSMILNRRYSSSSSSS